MKSFLRDIAHKYFSNFAYFYSHLRYRIFVLLGLSIFVGVLDGFGLAMFLPLLEMVSDQGGTASSEQMGNLAFLVNGMEALGLNLTLTVVLVTMLLFFTFKGIFKFIEIYKRVVYQQFFMRNIRVTNIKALSEYSYDHFVNADSGRIQNTLTGEIERVNQAFSFYMQVIQQSVLVIVYAGLAFMVNPEFALLVALGGILTNYAFGKLYKATKRMSRNLTEQNHGFQGLLIQQVSMFKYFKATGLIRDYAKRLIDKVCKIEVCQRKIGILNGIMQGIREPLLIGIVVIVIMIQINILDGSLALIILSILFFYRALNSVMQLQSSWNSFLGRVGALENLTAFSAEIKKGKEKRGKKEYVEFNEAIELQDVSLKYGETTILKNIQLTIPKNNTIAFVGESGSGKTTLMNMISGLLKPEKGKILIDKTSFQDLDIVSYQKRIGYITQEPVIFNDTVFNNVTFWDDKTTENIERFETALRRAKVYDYIMKECTDAENTMLGNNGINLSGGQRQRISIARELYKDVDFLFMDEATSALDSETEREIQDNIDNLKGYYTIIIVAHRLSTIRNVDSVIVLSKGKIIEIGSFDELSMKSNVFQRMTKLQKV